MKISIVMSVFNGAEYLNESIDSILQQTFTHFEMIIVNNASTDETQSILAEYLNIDERVKVITNNSTVPLVIARNQAIAESTTEWVALMDADDISEPTRLERQANFIRKFGLSLGALGTWARYIDAQGNILGNKVTEPTTVERFWHMFARNEAITLTDPSAIIHRPTFLSIGGYRSEYTPAADLDLWYRVAESGKVILVIPEFLLKYRVHLGADSVHKSMLQRKKTHFINFNMRRRRSHQSELGWNQYLDQVWASPGHRLPKLRTDYAMTWYKHAGLYFGEHHFEKCLLYLIMAFFLKPGFVIRRLLSQKATFLQKKITL